jgi:hypothetical protein
MTRPALTWTLLWLAVASAVAVGIVAGFLVLRLLAPDVAIAASRPVAIPTSIAPRDLSGPAATSGWPLPGVPLVALRSPDPITASDRVLARANEAPTGSPLVQVAPSVRRPNVAAGITEPRAGITGTASWWASFGPGIYAALPGYVAGTHVTIRVWSGKLHVDAPVITSCQCLVGTPDERIVDVSPGILAALGLDPGRGLYPVAIEVLP